MWTSNEKLLKSKEKKHLKTLFVVSGGDAPGINAVMAYYTALTTRYGHEVVGARDGFAGLVAGNLVPLTGDVIGPWASQPGSYLPSSRVPVLKDAEGQQAMADMLSQHGIDNVILFGGNGTLRYIPPVIAQLGIPCIGLPTTIDNDVPGTDLTLGFDSACNFAYHAIDGALATGRALPGRIFMVETLGGFSGMIALDVAFGAGAHAVLVPEYAYDDAWLGQRLLEAAHRDGYALLVLSEGVAASRTLFDDILLWTNIRVRDIRLGHAQRGGIPTHRDRTLAAQMARLSFEALNANVLRGTVVVRDGQTLLHEGGLEGPARLPDADRYNFVNGLDSNYEPARN